jgi:ABC-type uncharacterized transport system permease subunit
MLLSGGEELLLLGIPQASVEVFKGIMLLALISGTFFEKYQINVKRGVQNA